MREQLEKIEAQAAATRVELSKARSRLNELPDLDELEEEVAALRQIEAALLRVGEGEGMGGSGGRPGQGRHRQAREGIGRPGWWPGVGDICTYMKW